MEGFVSGDELSEKEVKVYVVQEIMSDDPTLFLDL